MADFPVDPSDKLQDAKPVFISPDLDNPADCHARLFLDPTTGLLTSRTDTHSAFSAQRKLEFIKLAYTHWPNIGKLCKMVGIGRQTYLNHLRADKKFFELMEEVKESHMDEEEEAMVKFGKEKSGFIRGLASLRAYRPERWNPDNKVTVEHKYSVDEATDRLVRMAKVINADIVPDKLLPGSESGNLNNILDNNGAE